jgi:hypothetical protein
MGFWNNSFFLLQKKSHKIRLAAAFLLPFFAAEKRKKNWHFWLPFFCCRKNGRIIFYICTLFSGILCLIMKTRPERTGKALAN